MKNQIVTVEKPTSKITEAQNPFVSAIRSVKNDVVFLVGKNTQEEVENWVKTLTNNDQVRVEISQYIPDLSQQTEDESNPYGKDFNLTSRLEGHDNAIPQREFKTLVGWVGFMKNSYLKKEFLSLGNVLDGRYISLQEVYIPASELKIPDTQGNTRGLDIYGNVVLEPIINPNTNYLQLIDNKGKIEPVFRTVHLALSPFTPTPKPKVVEVVSGFDGQKKLMNRKTQEYQTWLNQFAPSGNPITDISNQVNQEDDKHLLLQEVDMTTE